MVALISIVNLFGTNVVAAYTIATRIESLVFLPAMNFAAALATFTGQNIGAQKLNRIKTGYIETLKIVFLITVISSVVIILFSGFFVKIFTSDNMVISLSKEYLNIVSFFFVFFAFMFVNNGVLRGAGDTLVPMFITLLSLWLVRVPLAYFLSTKFGYIGIWWAIPIAWFLGMIFSYLYYKTGSWKHKSIVKPSVITEEVITEP